MTPLTLGVLAALGTGFVALLVLLWVVRAWIRTLKWMVKLAFWAFVTLLVAGGIGAAVTWVLYGEQLRAIMAGSGATGG